MTRIFRYVVGFVLCCHATDVTAQATAQQPNPASVKKVQPVYTVSKYDPLRKSAEDLAATIKRAKAERKRIILEVGGNW